MEYYIYAKPEYIEIRRPTKLDYIRENVMPILVLILSVIDMLIYLYGKFIGIDFTFWLDTAATIVAIIAWGAGEYIGLIETEVLFEKE